MASILILAAAIKMVTSASNPILLGIAKLICFALFAIAIFTPPFRRPFVCAMIRCKGENEKKKGSPVGGPDCLSIMAGDPGFEPGAFDSGVRDWTFSLKATKYQQLIFAPMTSDTYLLFPTIECYREIPLLDTYMGTRWALIWTPKFGRLQSLATETNPMNP
jgi:hypothetical protein